MKSLRFYPLLCLGLAIAGCGPKTDSASNSTASSGNSTTASTAPTGTLTILSPHNPEIQNEFATMWKAQNPGSDIKWLDQGGTSQILNYVRQKFAGSSKDKGIGVDIFFGGGGETFTELDDDGLLKKLPSDYGVPADLNGIPLRGKNNDWVAAALSGFGILYNKSIATRDKLPVPTSWEGLADPKLRDRIQLVDPRQSGSAHTAYEIILQANGWDKGWKILTGMTGNARAFSESGAAPLQDVQNGEAVFCPSIDFYARAAINQAGADKLGYIEPKTQTVVTADPIAILAGAPNSGAAEKFVKMVMSKEGQALWFLPKGSKGGPTTSDLFRLPALPASYKPIPKGASTDSDPFGRKNALKYDADKAAARRRALDDLIGTVLIDNKDAVKAAWAKNPSLDATGFVPIPEAEFMKVAADWNKPEVQNAKKDEWAAASAAKFK